MVQEERRDEADRLVKEFDKFTFKFANLKPHGLLSVRGLVNIIEGAIISSNRVDPDYDLNVVASNNTRSIYFHDGNVAKNVKHSDKVDPDEPIKKKLQDVGSLKRRTLGCVGYTIKGDAVYLIQWFDDNGKAHTTHENGWGEKMELVDGDLFDKRWVKVEKDGDDNPELESIELTNALTFEKEDIIRVDFESNDQELLDAEKRVVDMIRDKLAQAELEEEIESLDFKTVGFICRNFLKEGNLSEELAALYETVKDNHINKIKNPPGKKWGDVRLIMDEKGNPNRTHEVRCCDKSTKLRKFEMLVTARNVETASKIAQRALKESGYYVDSIYTL